MTICPPSDGEYELPPPEDCEEWSQREFLAAGHLLVVRQVFRRGQSIVVDFSVNQSIRLDGKWRPVARIDCFHGTVHRHQFTEEGQNRIDVLEAIPADHGEEVVDRWYETATVMMENEWEENVRRWSGDSQ